MNLIKRLKNIRPGHIRGAVCICLIVAVACCALFNKDSVISYAFDGASADAGYKYIAGERDAEVVDSSSEDSIICNLDTYGDVSSYVYGEEESATVGDLLSYAQVDPSEGDVVNYSLSTPLSAGMTVSVQDVSYSIQTVTESIPHGTVMIPTIYGAQNDLFDDVAGSDGTMSVQKAVKYVNGQVEEEVIVSSTVISEPVDAVVYVDQSELLDLGDGAPVEYVDKFEAELTAYTYNEVGDSITASGEAARVGYVAVDRSVIPMHSYLYIVTDSGFVYGYCYAKDVGGAVKGNIIDIFLPSTEDCIQFGRRSATCYVVRYGS